MLTQPVEPPTVLEVCGEGPSFICREVFERTESRRWAEFADIVFSKPFTIALVLVVAWVVNRVASRVISRFEKNLVEDSSPGQRLKRKLRKTTIGQRLPHSVLDTGVHSLRASARAATLGVVLRSVVAFLIWSIAGITILGELGINLGPLIASAGIAGVALGFGAQSLVRDFLAGIFILIEDQFGVGDIIDVGDLGGTQVVGTVEAVSLRTTRLRDVDGTVWHVPNGTVLRVGNMSQQWARALLDIPVAYGADVDRAERLIKETADALANEQSWKYQILEEPEVWGVQSLGIDGVEIRLVVKTRPSLQWGVARELRRRIKKAFHDAGIEIPFPQRTVWLRHTGDDMVEPFDPPPSTEALDDADGPERAPDGDPDGHEVAAEPPAAPRPSTARSVFAPVQPTDASVRRPEGGPSAAEPAKGPASTEERSGAAKSSGGARTEDGSDATGPTRAEGAPEEGPPSS